MCENQTDHQLYQQSANLSNPLINNFVNDINNYYDHIKPIALVIY